MEITAPLTIAANCSQIYTKSAPVNNCSPPPTPDPPFPPRKRLPMFGTVYRRPPVAKAPVGRKGRGEQPAANEHAMRLQHATSPPLKGFGRGTPPSRGRVRAACRPVHPCLRCVEVAEPLLMPAPRFVSLLHTCLVSSPPTPKHQMS